MKKANLVKIATKLSEGTLSSVTNLTLFTFFLTLSSFGKTPMYSGYDQAFREAQTILNDINYHTIKQALFHLKKQGLLTYKKRRLHTTLSFTPKGKVFLQKLLPIYKQHRKWGGRIYLVIYDIPETRHRVRVKLRQFIQHWGAAMLQKSVWITFTNPKTAIKTFVQEYNLAGVVIVTDMGKDASIGDEDVYCLVQRLYRLDRLNITYDSFITWATTQSPTSFQVITRYLSILKADPQLPFSLLPPEWNGEKAYQIYLKHGGNLLV